MSGFFAIVNADGCLIDRAVVPRLVSALSPSGPNQHDAWCDGPVALGRALLWDTPASIEETQPLDHQADVQVAADARLDDRQSILEALVQRGYPVKSGTADVELIRFAYLAWGEECPAHLCGDFAFVVWDARRRRLFGARDHFGVRPFYFAVVASTLVASSALDCVRAHPAISRRLDPHVVGDLLASSVNSHDDRTVFADIRQLPPAHTLVWDGQAVSRRYWTLPPSAPASRQTRSKDYVEQFRTLFVSAVADRMRGSHVGAHLSGGMDSSSIVAAAHHTMAERGDTSGLRTFTVVSRGLFDEEEGVYAGHVAAALGLAREEFVLEDHLLRTASDQEAWRFPEPSVIAHQSPLHAITMRSSATSSVLMMGFGGDGLFHDGRPSGPLWRRGVRAILRRGRSPRVPQVPPWIERQFAARVGLADRLRDVAEAEHRRRESDQALLTSPYWTSIFNWSHPGFTGSPTQGVFPFFDLRLVQLLREAPSGPWRTDKQLLREAMHGWLPDVVRLRPKRLLYAPRRGNTASSPWYKIATDAGVQRWRRDLVTSVPSLWEYVDRTRVLGVIDTPDPAMPAAIFDATLAMADWLRYRLSRAV